MTLGEQLDSTIYELWDAIDSNKRATDEQIQLMHEDFNHRLMILEGGQPTTPVPSEPRIPAHEIVQTFTYDSRDNPSEHVAAGSIAYVPDPRGGPGRVAQYLSTGRAEHWHSDHVALDDRRTYVYKGRIILMPGWVKRNTRWLIVRQWHNGVGSPGFSFQIGGDGSVFKVIRRATRPGGEYDASLWSAFTEDVLVDHALDYSVLAIWSKDDDGRFQMRINGAEVPVVDYRGPTLKPTATTLYGKNGAYQSDGETETYADNTIIARADYWDSRLHLIG